MQCRKRVHRKGAGARADRKAKQGVAVVRSGVDEQNPQHVRLHWPVKCRANRSR